MLVFGDVLFLLCESLCLCQCQELPSFSLFLFNLCVVIFVTLY